jgi:hypothetical protein
MSLVPLLVSQIAAQPPLFFSYCLVESYVVSLNRANADAKELSGFPLGASLWLRRRFAVAIPARPAHADRFPRGLSQLAAI